MIRGLFINLIEVLKLGKCDISDQTLIPDLKLMQRKTLNFMKNLPDVENITK